MIGENAGQEVRARHIIIEDDDLGIVTVSSLGDSDGARAPRQSRQINDVLLQPGVVAVVTEIALEIDGIRREIKPAKDIQAIETDVQELTVIGQGEAARIIAQVIGGLDAAELRINNYELI